MFSLSPTSIRVFEQCPRRFRLRAAGAGRGETSAALSFGVAVHEALADIHRAGRWDAGPREVEELLSRRWAGDGYSDAEEADGYFAMALAALINYLRSPHPAALRVIGAEVFMSRTLVLGHTAARLSGRADLIGERGDGALEVVDFKTSSGGRIPTAEWMSRDKGSFVYFVLARLCFPEYRRVVVSQLNLLSLARVEVTYEGDTLAENKRALTDLIRSVAADDAQARPGEHCYWCASRDRCDAYAPRADLDAV
jgi:putative RecB family exonuclease